MKKLSALGIVLLFLLQFAAFSQETSSSFSGRLTDENNKVVSSASILLKHEPTGQQVMLTSNEKGIFYFTELKPGGPYTLTITHTGFQDINAKDIFLSLGVNPDVNISMKLTTATMNEVTVTGKSRKNDGSLTVGAKQLQTLPSIGRSLTDFTRLTPQSNNNSYAGSNFRYNNLTIDGSINNDAFGFSNSAGGTSGGGQAGAAGAGTRTNPYSIDVIQEVQVQLTPFDVKLGNFTGGSVNAVTKSGTNDLHGAVYSFGRNDIFVGKSVDGQKTSIGHLFHDFQLGATIGGAFKKNKAFYIFNYEHTDRQEPTTYNVGDPGAAMTLTEGQQIVAKLKTQYGYDPGSFEGAYKIYTLSDKLFGRLDFNLDKKNTLTIRGIYTQGKGNNLERSSTNFQFGSADFTQYTKNINLTAELKTRFSSRMSNQLNLSFIKVHEYRDFPGTIAPYIDIDNGRITLGTWREASIYNLTQKTIEISDNLTYTKGIHKFTLGTHNEIYDLTYGFINSYNGRWEYSRGLTSFLNDNPSRIRGAFITNPNLSNDRDEIFNNPPNPYKIGLMSLYFQDEISINKKFKVSPGLRFDYSYAGNQPQLDTGLAATNSAGYVAAHPTYFNTPFKELTGKLPNRIAISPRLGFRYEIKDQQRLVLRGGTGIFTGRVPFAWYGYAYTLNGSTYGNIDWNGPASGVRVPLAINPQGLKDTVTKYGGASRSSTHEVDVFDNNFKLPTVWRSNLALDVKFGKGFKFTADVLYTKTIYDVKFEQINLKDSVAYFNEGPTSTPVYVGGKYNSKFSNVFLLTNTKEGYRYNLTAQLAKTNAEISVFKKKWGTNWSLAYTYGMSKDISNGIRNSWESNYNVNPSIIPGNSALSYSNFDLRHRIVATFAASLKWNDKQTTNLTFFYAGSSGNPYSLVYQSAPFGNGSNAMLPYIPKDASDIHLRDNGTYTAAQQWTDLENFINNDSYLKNRKGQYAERNAMRTPWVHGLDMKLMHEFALNKNKPKQTLQISLDIINVLNLINNDWGHINFVTNLNNYTANFLKFVTDQNGKAPGAPGTGYIPTFNFVKPSGINNQYYSLDPINSRWQGQFGIKFNF